MSLNIFCWEAKACCTEQYHQNRGEFISSIGILWEKENKKYVKKKKKYVDVANKIKIQEFWLQNQQHHQRWKKRHKNINLV